MSDTGVQVFDTTIHKTDMWLKDVMEELGLDNKHRAYVALRSVLHTLRDRLPVEEAADLGAQLPMLVRGFYYDAWNPLDNPIKFNKDEFLSMVSQQFLNEPDVDAEEIIRAVFHVIDKHIAYGEIEDIKSSLPVELRGFWESQSISE
jgi:uncharacterized protein (DUF2267 family)